MKRAATIIKLAFWAAVVAAALYGFLLSVSSCLDRVSKHEDEWAKKMTTTMEQKI